MNDRTRISLSSIAVGVSAVALLGISSEAMSDPATGCNSGAYCVPPPPPGVEGWIPLPDSFCTIMTPEGSPYETCGCAGWGNGYVGGWIFNEENQWEWGQVWWFGYAFNPGQAECLLY